jgi:hypothetical protein
MLKNLTGSAAIAAGILRKNADVIEGEPQESGLATPVEMAVIGRIAIAVMSSEFETMATECVSLIDAGNTTEARARLADVARKLGKRPSIGG